MTSEHLSTVIVNDASCLIDLRKGGLLRLLIQLPHQVVIPLPVQESELIKFTAQEMKMLKSGAAIYDLPPEQIKEAYKFKSSYPRLSFNDCACLVTTRYHDGAILLTGDKQLRDAAKSSDCCVHGVLWVIDEIERLELCNNAILIKALESWLNDPTVRLPPDEINRRIRRMK